MQTVISVGAIVFSIIYNKIPKILHIGAWIVCLFIVIFAFSLAIYGKTTDADYTEDVVIVLGAGLRTNDSVSPHLYWRLISASEYFNENPDAVLIVCGGLGARQTITEAEAMARFLIDNGVPETSIIKEEQSTSTYENLTFAKEILDGYFPEGFRAVLITNDFHIYRAVRLSRQVGMPVSRKGAVTPSLTLLVNYLREIIAVMNMWILG
jgi:uncharacterized SAM-binding protein YcdF (DUF218 family)